MSLIHTNMKTYFAQIPNQSWMVSKVLSFILLGWISWIPKNIHVSSCQFQVGISCHQISLTDASIKQSLSMNFLKWKHRHCLWHRHCKNYHPRFVSLVFMSTDSCIGSIGISEVINIMYIVILLHYLLCFSSVNFVYLVSAVHPQN